MGQLKPGSEREDEVITEATIQEPAKVILFNDEVHTFDEVINQIIKATGCHLSRAQELTWEVHHNGKAVIYEGEFVRCMSVSGVLEEIELTTQIEV
jgi:ATP-dependent Clp protease adaptor protein ClpS